MSRIGIVVGTLALAMGACRAPVAKSPAAPFTLSLSSGGGFAGSYQGYTLASTGEVSAWQQTAAGPRNVLWTKKAQPESIAAFARGLEPYRETKLDQAGNMTLSLGYASAQGEYAWTVPGAGASPDAPEPFRTWYGRIEAFCRSLAPGP